MTCWECNRVACEDSGFPGVSVAKHPPANAGDAGDVASIPGSGGFPSRRKWLLTPAFLLENSLVREGWQVAFHGVAKSPTWFSNWAHTRAYENSITLLSYYFEEKLGWPFLAIGQSLLLLLRLSSLRPSEKNVCSIVSYPVVHEEVKGRGKEGINFKSGAVSREPRGTSRCGRPQSWLPWLSAGTSWLDVLVKGQSWTALSCGGSGPRPLSNFPASCNLRQYIVKQLSSN